MRPPGWPLTPSFSVGAEVPFCGLATRLRVHGPTTSQPAPNPLPRAPAHLPVLTPFRPGPKTPSTPQLPYGLSPCGAPPTPLDSHGGGGETPLPPWPPLTLWHQGPQAEPSFQDVMVPHGLCNQKRTGGPFERDVQGRGWTGGAQVERQGPGPGGHRETRPASSLSPVSLWGSQPSETPLAGVSLAEGTQEQEGRTQ